MEQKRSRPSPDKRWLVVLCLLPIAVAACLLLFFFPPWQYDFWPKCLLYQFTGIHCPGCGCTRALAALVHGDLRKSLACNVLLIPYAIVILVTILCPKVTLNRFFAWGLATVIILFFILRNLPWHPFCLLAPH